MPAYQGSPTVVRSPIARSRWRIHPDFLSPRRTCGGRWRYLERAPLDDFAPAAAPPRRVRGSWLRKRRGIGTVGRLSEQKAHHVLLDAAARLLPTRPRAWVLIAGDGDRMPALQAQAQALGIAPRVVFAGHRADVPAVLGAIDVFCISSDYEGTPLALFEAMASGKTIVSTAVAAARVLGGNTASSCRQGPEALAVALARVADDAELRARLSRMAREASRRYDIGECVRRMEDLYDDVLRGRPRS